jgi:hypothetical protein
VAGRHQCIYLAALHESVHGTIAPFAPLQRVRQLTEVLRTWSWMLKTGKV